MEKRNRTSKPNARPRRLTVRVSYDARDGLLEVLKPGEVIDRPLEDEIEIERENFCAFRRGRRGPVIGFAVKALYDFDVPQPDDPLAPHLRFDVPTLGLRDATVEQVILTARSVLGGYSTPDVVFFDLAAGAGEEGDDEQAEIYWRACLMAGDPKAHFGLGCTLCDLDRGQEAYGHLREYTRVQPRNAWAWTWLGQAYEGIDEPRQAAKCYRRAIRLEKDAGFETDAAERLERLLG